MYCNKQSKFLIGRRQSMYKINFMNLINLKSSGFLVLLLTGVLISNTAFAEKPAWAGHDGEKKKHHKKHERDNNDRHGSGNSNDLNVQLDVYFGDDDRVVVHDYYDERYSRGHCPPGLAKKRNGWNRLMRGRVVPTMSASSFCETPAGTR